MSGDPISDQQLLFEVAKLAEFDACHAIWWRFDDGHLSLFTDCSDVFACGGSDVERITPENLPILRSAVADYFAVVGPDSHEHRDAGDGFTLFAARVRSMRPHPTFYSDLKVHVSDPGPLNEYGYPTWVPNKTKSAERTEALCALFDAAGPARIPLETVEHRPNMEDK